MTDQDPKLMKTTELVSFLKEASLAYRNGSPIIDDHIEFLFCISMNFFPFYEC